MHYSLSRDLVRAACLLFMPAVVVSCADTPRSVAGESASAATTTPTLEIDTSSELHPGAADGELTADEWQQPLTVAGRFLQRLLNPTGDDDARRYATARLAAELADRAPDASSSGDDTETARVASVRMLRRFDDWATATAIIERAPQSPAAATADGVDVYLLTLMRQQDDRWLVADVALR